MSTCLLALLGIPSGWELLLVVVVLAALFVPKRLSGLAKSLGKAKGAYDDGLKTGREAQQALADAILNPRGDEEAPASEEIVEVEPDEA